MDQTKEHLENLSEIRSLMERSSRFISLSGLSGVFAGSYALLGALAAFYYLPYDYFSFSDPFVSLYNTNHILFIIGDALAVLTLALSTGLIFTLKKARKKGQKIWDQTSQRLLINLAIPLVTGGLFSLSLLYSSPALVAPATLIFYGLSLVNGSKFTLNDVRYLGFTEIALGLISTLFLGYGLFFWALGFGVMHIIYGIVMYFKYDK
jgi:hypothetical protein